MAGAHHRYRFRDYGSVRPVQNQLGKTLDSEIETGLTHGFI